MLIFPFRSAFLLFLVGTLSLATAVARADEPYVLKKIVIADSEAKAAKAGPDTGGDTPIVVEGVPLLQESEFLAIARGYLGKPINTELLSGLTNAILAYAKSHDRLLPQIQVPNHQDISAGTLRLAVLTGRYNQLVIHGNHWFSQKLLEQKLGIKPGDEIRASVLEEAVNWANANPFRDVKVVVNPVAGEPGKADIYVNVNDVRPVRLAVGYNNDGVPVLGRNQYNASIQLGNLWGRDHQASYQFITNGTPKEFQAHVASYSIPLPWHHYAEFNGSYVEARPKLYGGAIDQTAESTALNFRYRIPLGSGDRASEVYLGTDFKESNNNLQYGGLSISSAKLDIFDLVAGYTAVRKDTKGAWVFSANVNASPGNINSRNTDRQFQPLVENGSIVHVGRLGARARYLTGTLSVQRLQKFPHDWQLFSRGLVQLASSNLVSEEQLTIGGSGTLRGFDPNVFAGEQGYVLNNDLQTPEWRHTFAFLPKRANTLSARLTLFYDAAQVFYKIHNRTVDLLGRPVGWDDDYLRPLASAGVGLRANIASNLSLSFDYGWQVTHPKAPLDSEGRGHVKVVLAF